jgi:RNA polymerase subunit RPABC4/transcription elongation factor Spt4
MALINCFDCGSQISDKAESCIKCGAPIVKREFVSCFECGTQLEKGTKACFNCGAEQENLSSQKSVFNKENLQQEEKLKDTKKTQSDQVLEVKKSPFKKIIIFLFIVILTILVIMVINNPNSLPGVNVQVNMPKPVVIESHADGKNSGIFNARATIYAIIQNQGGPGNVLVTFNVNQGTNTYDRSKSIYLNANETSSVEMTFEEVNYLDGEITYNVNAVFQ